jgi:hypothetical protein
MDPDVLRDLPDHPITAALPLREPKNVNMSIGP